jgi:pilus assembly protein CpaF
MTLTRPDTHADLMEELDARVREQVRTEGVDPQRDNAVVRRIAQDVVRHHDERSLTGAVVPVADPGAVVGELIARVSGFGPLQPFLDDPEVEEVWINDPSRVFIARRGRHELTNLMLSAAQVHELIERMLKSSGRRIDISQPFVDAMLPEGHRLHVVLEGISRGFSAVNVRKFVVRARRLEDLVELGSLTAPAAAFLDASIRAGLNVLVAGGTQAGKTTFLNCLAAAIPGGDRVVSAEEVFELQFNHPDWVPMQTRQAGLEGTGEILLRDLVKEALRMRPSRVIVGEVRAEECLDLLLALNAGLPGMCTLHANSAREALVKMCTLPLLAGDNRQIGMCNLGWGCVSRDRPVLWTRESRSQATRSQRRHATSGERAMGHNQRRRDHPHDPGRRSLCERLPHTRAGRVRGSTGRDSNASRRRCSRVGDEQGIA